MPVRDSWDSRISLFLSTSPNLNTYTEPRKAVKSTFDMICTVWDSYLFILLPLAHYLHTTVQQDGDDLCSYALRIRLQLECFVPPACNLSCRPCCYISSQWCQAGLWSAITLGNNRFRGQPKPNFLAGLRNATLETGPAPPLPALIGWNIVSVCRFWHVIYCRQRQRASRLINHPRGRACFMGITSLLLNYAWVFPERWGWM